MRDAIANVSPRARAVGDEAEALSRPLSRYAGDVGRVVEKSAAGDYRLRFEDSVHPQFGVKRRPFSLWLGRWWVAEATRGFGIVPGGRVPLVSVPDDAAAPPPPLPAAAAPAAARAPEDDARVAKYARMLRAGVPKAAVARAMRADGLDPAAVLTEGKEDARIERFRAVLRVGAPRAAVACRMRAAGLDPAVLEEAPPSGA